MADEAFGRMKGFRSLLWPASVWFGLGSGLLEVVVLAVRKRWLEPTFLLSPQFVWMVPVDAVSLLVAAGVGVFATARLLPGRIAYPVAIFSLAFLSCLGPLFAVPRLHYLAVLLLAAGSAAQLTRLVLRSSDRYFALAPRTIGLMVALVVCLGAGLNGWRSLQIHRAISALPAPPANAPNVVLIVLDTVRTESLSLYGYPKPTTPELERLAKTAVVFDAAIAPAPWTLPSHASMFTGHWPHELSADWKSPLDSTYPTLADVLRARGYVTEGFVANLIYGSAVHGLNRGFIGYEDFPVSAGQTVLSSSLGAMISSDSRLRRVIDNHRILGRKTAGEVNGEFLSWLSHRDQRPFFAFLNYMDAHEPYLPPAPYDTQFGPPRQRTNFVHSTIDAFRPGKWAMSPKEAKIEVGQYDGAIAYIDHEVGRVVSELQTRHLLDNTLLIVVSDHGEHLGEHRQFGHGNSLYRQVIGVPLVIAFHDRIPGGTTIHEPVTLRDIPATVLDLIGAESGTPFPGASLSRFWRRQAPDRQAVEGPVLSEASRRAFGVQQPWYPLFKGNMRSIVQDGFHYIQNDNGDEELYDFERDHLEERNLAQSTEGRQLVARLRATLAETVARPTAAK
jgi:arylsulfatase A-like enzyme